MQEGGHPRAVGDFMKGRIPFMKRKAGFTMAEVIVAIMIIGVLAALAVPNYRIHMLRVRNQEAVRVLMFLWEAQKEYYREHGFYASSIPGELGMDLVDLPPPKNFVYPVVENGGSAICQGQLNNVLAAIQTVGPPFYSLAIVADGSIFCCNWDGLCPKMASPIFDFSVRYTWRFLAPSIIVIRKKICYPSASQIRLAPKAFLLGFPA